MTFVKEMQASQQNAASAQSEDEPPQVDMNDSGDGEDEDDKASTVGGSSVFYTLPVVFPAPSDVEKHSTE